MSTGIFTKKTKDHPSGQSDYSTDFTFTQKKKNYEYLNSEIQAQDDWIGEQNENTSENEGRDIGIRNSIRFNMFENWIKVPDNLVFIRSVVEERFETKIQIENLSSWNITYCVRTSSLEKFHMIQSIGVIGPNHKTEVIILSNPVKVKNFGEICREGFTVLATPVYYDSQLQAKKIRLLWRAYGTEPFPYDSAEPHKIKILLPANDSYLDDYSIIEKAALGAYVAQSDRMDAEWNLKPIKNSKFYDNWTPTESDHTIGLTLARQVQDFKAAVKVLKQQSDMLKDCARTAVASVVVIGLSILTFWGYSLDGRAFGSNGQPLNPEPKPWWKLF